MFYEPYPVFPSIASYPVGMRYNKFSYLLQTSILGLVKHLLALQIDNCNFNFDKNYTNKVILKTY